MVGGPFCISIALT